MQHEDDVERLFSWLKTPELRYREFASERDVADAAATWPALRRTAEDATPPPGTVPASETVPPPQPRVVPAAPLPAPPPVARAGDVPVPSALPAGERLMSALGRRVRAARGEADLPASSSASPLPNAAPNSLAAAPPAPPVGRSDAAAIEAQRAAAARQAAVAAAASERAAAMQRTRVQQEARLAEQARALEDARAAAQARAAEARAAGENRARQLAEQRARDEADRQARDVADAAPPPPPPPRGSGAAAPGRTAARPPAARVFANGERSSLFGGNYRGDRPASVGERRGRPLNAVFSRLAESEEEPAGEPGPRAPVARRP